MPPSPPPARREDVGWRKILHIANQCFSLCAHKHNAPAAGGFVAYDHEVGTKEEAYCSPGRCTFHATGFVEGVGRKQFVGPLCAFAFEAFPPVRQPAYSPAAYGRSCCLGLLVTFCSTSTTDTDIRRVWNILLS